LFFKCRCKKIACGQAYQYDKNKIEDFFLHFLKGLFLI